MLASSNLVITHGGAKALGFADFTLGKGESALLLGPSGCGKTTLLSCLAGLLAPRQGTVRWQGEDLYAMPAPVRDRIRGRNFGFVFQTLHLLPSLSVKRNILLAAEMAKIPVDETRLEFLLQSLGLDDKAGRKPDELSQGERQRVAIARAVLNRPAVLIADEPTSALDDDNTERTMDLLRRQAREDGAALLVATHDRRIAHGFDHIISVAGDQRRAV